MEETNFKLPIPMEVESALMWGRKHSEAQNSILTITWPLLPPVVCTNYYVKDKLSSN